MSGKTGILLAGKKPRHEKGVRLDKAWKDDEDARKAQERNGIAKRSTTVNAATAKATGAGGDGVPGPMAPNDEQLAKINHFTRSPKSAEEVVVVQTLSCNTLEDRDEDRFTEDCIADLHKLPAPFSFVGKGFMLDHTYKMDNAVGRIFDEGTAKGEMNGETFDWLTHEVYLPNTPQFAPLIEKMDFGIAWAVSVGLMLGKSACSVCGGGFSSWGYWCANGHDKGYYYLEDAETDQWGYPLPVDSNTSGAIKCIREFSEPQDGYELSQVFLGAQYFAGQKAPGKELTKATKSVTIPKEFGGYDVPIIGLAAKEAEALPFRVEPPAVTEARERFGVTTEDDGTLRWTDEHRKIWVFDPDGERQVLLLGAESDDDGDDDSNSKDGEPDDGERTEVPDPDGSEGVGDEDQPLSDGLEGDEAGSVGQGDEGSDPDGEGSSSGQALSAKTFGDLRAAQLRAKALLTRVESEAEEAEPTEDAEALTLSLEALTDEIEEVLASAGEDTDDDEPLDDEAAELLEATDEASDSLDEELGDDDDADDEADDEAEETEADKATKALMRLALKSGIPAGLVGKWRKGDDKSPEALIALVGKALKEAGPNGTPELRQKADIGDRWIKELRSQAEASYALSHRDPKNPSKGVSVDSFRTSILDKIGDDPEALLAVIADNRKTAQDRFPAPVRRSTVPTNPEDQETASEIETDDGGGSTGKASSLHPR